MDELPLPNTLSVATAGVDLCWGAIRLFVVEKVAEEERRQVE